MSIRIKIKEIALSPGVGPYSIQRTSDVIEPDGEVSQDLTKFTSALEEDMLDEKRKKTKKSKKVKADRKRQRKKAKKSAKKKKKDDRCTRIAKSKYKTWPSAYASGAVVRCRRGKIWKGLKEVLSEEKFKQHTMYNPETGEEEVAKTHEDHARLAKKGFTHVDPEELRKVLKDEGGASGMDPFVKATDAEEKEIEDTLDDMKDVGQHKYKDYILDDDGQIKVVKEGIRIRISETLDEKKKKKKKKKKSKKKKAGTESRKEKHLGDWFDRQGGSGGEGGWVDCNTCRKNKKTGRTKCKKCGRDKGEKRAKYPACRPTPGACKERGRGESWGKKTAKGKKG